VIADVDTAVVYGRQAGAAMASIASLDIEDPAASSAILIDQMTGLADALGFNLADAGPGVGIMGAVIDNVSKGVKTWTESQKARSDAARDAAQELILRTISKRYEKRGKWIVELPENDLAGNGGYYWDVRAVGLPGALKKELKPGLDLAERSGRGCLMQGNATGAGKAASRLWRFWPALFPVIYNTQQLTLKVRSIASDDARDIMLALARSPFDDVGNLLIDGREVAATLSALKDWARPLFRSDLGTASKEQPNGAPITPAGPNMRLPPGYETSGARYVYENPDGTLQVYKQSDESWPKSPNYTPYVRWLQTDRGVISMEPIAYNHVIKTCARFFAYREALLLRAVGPRAWDKTLRDVAALSSEPSVKAALTRKPTRTPVGRPNKPTTTGVNKPTPQAQKPSRVGRLDAWPTIAAIENLIAETTT